jgi:hypothetical protein
MKEDRLETLLRLADEAHQPGPGPANLGSRVRQAARRRRLVRAATAMMLPLIAAATLWHVIGGGGAVRWSAPVALRAPSTNVLPLANLAGEARIQEGVTQRLLLTEKSHQADARHVVLAQLDPQFEFQRQLSQAAFITLNHGDKLLRLGLCDEARGEYQNVVQWCPHTDLESVAQTRLKALDNEKAGLR